MSNFPTNKKIINRRASKILGASSPWVFLLGLLAVGLINDGLSLLLSRLFGEDNPCRGWFVLIIGIAFLILIIWLFELPRKMRNMIDGLKKPAPLEITTQDLGLARTGLVTLVSVSKYSTVAEAAIDFHRRGKDGKSGQLKYCWLISDDKKDAAGTSYEHAQQIQEEYEKLGIVVIIRAIHNVDDPNEVFTEMNKIFHLAHIDYGLEPKDIISDFTGGTKTMTAGMVLACAAHDWDMQFMKTEKLDDAGRAIENAPSIPYKVDINFFHPHREEEQPV